nr:TipAS antibiotic-recognition domain-containing protein [Rhodothermaceae bacterium]
GRSEKGYRLYGMVEVQRLQSILSLQQLGFALEDIRQVLDHEEYSLPNVLKMHIRRVEDQIREQELLLSRLRSISEHCNRGTVPSINEVIDTIKMMKMHEKYYTEEQLGSLKKRREALGQEGMQKAQEDWTELNSAFRNAMENGLDPADEKVQVLVSRMAELIQAFTGGDPEVERSLGRMYQEEGPEQASRGAVDKTLFEYIGKARAASGSQ